MLRRRSTVCAMAALLIGGTAAAQSPGTLLLGGFGQWSHYDTSWGLDNGFSNSIGYGGRLGAFITPRWNLEADASYTLAQAKAGTRFMGVCPCSGGGAVGGDVQVTEFTARLLYNVPSGSSSGFHIGAGGVLENFRGPAETAPKVYHFGVNGLAGFNLGLGGLVLRVDGLVNYFNANGATFDYGAQAGLQFSPDLRGMSSNNYGPITWWSSDLVSPRPGTVELGAFGQWSWFDSNAGNGTTAVPKDGFGYGGLVGVFLSNPKWELQGDGYYSPQDNTGTTPANPTSVNAHAFALRMNYNVPIGGLGGRQSQLIVGAGAVRTSYRFEDPASGYNYGYGASGDLGLRLAIANRTAIRLDGVVDYMPSFKPDANLNLHARAGLSILLGGAQPQAMCTYAGLENIPASSANCVAPAPPPVAPLPAPAPAPAPMPAPAPAPYVAVDTAAITGPIYFDFDKSNIRPDADATLQRKLPWLNANPGMRIRIEGNADERGSDEYNIALGQRRAASAKTWLVNHGISADRFDTVSYGEERPVCTEHNETCWQQNRRDDFRIVTIGSDNIMVPPSMQ